MIWNPEPGELVALVELGEAPGDAAQWAPCHPGQVGLIIHAGNGLLEVLWPDGTVTATWAGAQRVRPVPTE